MNSMRTQFLEQHWARYPEMPKIQRGQKLVTGRIDQFQQRGFAAAAAAQKYQSFTYVNFQ